MFVPLPESVKADILAMVKRKNPHRLMGVVGAGVEIEGNALRYEYRINTYPIHNKNDVSTLQLRVALAV
ncbi:MAG: hypothetical protein IH991_18715 [Planctomycetes bacterium]|nr:hypothetical protein [Planctomycetota bacterium]